MNNNSIISWDAVVGAVDYEVIVVDSNGNANPPFNTVPLASSGSSNALSIQAGVIFNGLTAGTYRVQVRAIAAVPANNSLYTSPLNVVYDPVLPAPTNVNVT